MAESTFVRVRTGSGAEVSLARGYVDGLDDVEVLDEPATNLYGRPLPATRKDGRPKKPRTTVKKAAAKKAAASTPTGGAAASSSEEASA